MNILTAYETSVTPSRPRPVTVAPAFPGRSVPDAPQKRGVPTGRTGHTGADDRLDRRALLV